MCGPLDGEELVVSRCERFGTMMDGMEQESGLWLSPGLRPKVGCK